MRGPKSSASGFRPAGKPARYILANWHASARVVQCCVTPNTSSLDVCRTGSRAMIGVPIWRVQKENKKHDRCTELSLSRLWAARSLNDGRQEQACPANTIT